MLVGAVSQTQRHGCRANALGIVGVHEIGESAPETGWWKHHHVVADFHIPEQDFGFRDAAQSHGGLARSDHKALGLIADRQKPSNALLLAGFVENAGKYQMQPRYP